MNKTSSGWLKVLILFFAILYPVQDMASSPTEAEVLNAYLKVFPGVKIIGVIYSQAEHEEKIQRLEKVAKDKKIEVIKVRIPSIKEFPAALRVMKDNVDTFWVLDDPLFSITEAWSYFVMFTLRNGIKTVVFTEDALSRGGLFYSTESREIMINRHILDAFGLKIDEKAGPVKYYDKK